MPRRVRGHRAVSLKTAGERLARARLAAHARIACARTGRRRAGGLSRRARAERGARATQCGVRRRKTHKQRMQQRAIALGAA